jgi:two-component system chemotaxis response regulator CheY
MRTILVIDDSATMRQIVSFCLKGAGYGVVAVSDAAEVLSKLKTEKIDLVITDLNMPNVDGITLTKLIRAQPGSKYTPVLLLTTESSPERKAQGQAAGATGWLVKPFEPDQLLKVVKRVLPG